MPYRLKKGYTNHRRPGKPGESQEKIGPGDVIELSPVELEKFGFKFEFVVVDGKDVRSPEEDRHVKLAEEIQSKSRDELKRMISAELGKGAKTDHRAISLMRRRVTELETKASDERRERNQEAEAQRAEEEKRTRLARQHAQQTTPTVSNANVEPGAELFNRAELEKQFKAPIAKMAEGIYWIGELGSAEGREATPEEVAVIEAAVPVTPDDIPAKPKSRGGSKNKSAAAQATA